MRHRPSFGTILTVTMLALSLGMGVTIALWKPPGTSNVTSDTSQNSLPGADAAPVLNP